MAIRQAKYIDITSGVGGRSAVKNREFIARVFTTSELCGFGHVYEFDTLDAVGDHFGTGSEEYGFASKYFSFVSKSVTKAKKISFFKWASGYESGSGSGEGETYKPDAYVLGLVNPESDPQKYYVSNKTLVLRIDGTEYVYPVTFSSLSPSLSEVAEAVQTALRENDTFPLAYATVTINSNSKVVVDFGGYALTTANIEGFVPYTGVSANYDLGTLLGITTGSAIVSNYAATETPAEAAARSDALFDNYGSFVFLGGIRDTIDFPQTKAVAEWNKSKNYKYLFLTSAGGYTNSVGGLVDNNIVPLGTALKGVAPDTVVLDYRFTTDYIEALVAALFATTDFQRANSTKCYMYQQNDSIEPSITSDASANILDALNVNYMGVTQNAGGLIQFLQDGVACDGTDIGVVCNEIWMKSSFWSAIMNLLLTVEKVPANEDGVGILKTVMMDTINTAIRNGTIQPRKTLTTNQKVYIGQVTEDSEAWQDVYNNGYVLKLKIEADDNNRYVAKYVLVYSKGDAVRKVEGSDVLI